MTIRYEEHVPSPKEYCDMRVKAGLSPKSLKAAEIGLPNSLYGVSVRDEGKLIAMGRVVGDGACNFEIVDVAVDSDYHAFGRLSCGLCNSPIDAQQEHGAICRLWQF